MIQTEINTQIIGFQQLFAPNQDVFNHILSKSNIDKLANSGGISIVYTHFGYFMKNGKLDNGFVEKINLLFLKNLMVYLSQFRIY